MQPLLLSLALLASASASPHHRDNVSPSHLLSLLANPIPNGAAAIDPAFECGWRTLAFEYAQRLQPFRPASAFQDVHDGLELLTLCNTSFSLLPQGTAPLGSLPPPVPAAAAAASAAAAAATTLYIDFAAGSDSNPGTLAQPLQHVAAGVALARTLPRPAALLLRGGVHRLSATLQLTAEDSYLTIAAYPGETPVLTSGLVLKPVWTPVPSAAAAALPQARPAAGTAARRLPTASGAADCNWTVFPAEDAMFDDWPSPSVVNSSTASGYDACAARCQAYAPTQCHSWIWYSPSGGFGSIWAGMCFLRTDATWAPSPQANTWSGACLAPPAPPNIYVADLAAGGTPIPAALTDPSHSAVLTLHASPGGASGAYAQRAFRARWPNADLELDRFPTGWEAGATRARPACTPADFTVFHTPLPDNYGPGMFADYYFGAGSECDRFEVGEWLPSFQGGAANISYWCQPNGRTAGCSYLIRSPPAFTMSPSQLPHAPYARDIAGEGAVVQYWREGHWFSMMVRVAGVSVDGASNASTLTFGRGAFQGAEGEDSGAEWYIENVLEELDAPREFFHHAPSQRLYYFHNASAGTPPPAEWVWEVPTLQVLVNISGSAAAPAVNISISGLTVTGAAATYLAPHGIPSGGDWGLSRLGAFLLSGAANVSIGSNTFTRCDGNAIMLSGWNRGVQVDGNEFAWLGESGLASWGYTEGVDATAGQQPWGTSFTNNICREIGVYEKQVSCYFAATTALAVVSNNIMYNMPRAAVNFNDDMAGGSLLTWNLVWNTCLESQDHGPFNSWGRVPYLFPWGNGTVSGGIKVLNDELSYNFIVAGGGANGGSFDHDDGSSFYLDHHNFEIYGGFKSDFDGKGKRSANNIHAYSNVYGSKCVGIMNLPHDAPNDFFAEGFYGNKCVLSTASGSYLQMGSCTPDATLANRMLLGNNTIYTPDGNAMVSCGKSYTFAEWTALGFDAGTTVQTLPTTPEIIGWARELFNM